MSSTTWIQTFTGKRFDFEEISPERIDIVDIAHGLSLNCRFNGHCARFYSVAQHSVLVSELVPPENALWGLLHDAAEAYLGDITRPLKRILPNIMEIESKILEAVAQRFALPSSVPDAVFAADDKLLATEASQLMAEYSDGHYGPANPVAGLRITPWPWEVAEERFLSRADILLKEHELWITGERANS